MKNNGLAKTERVYLDKDFKEVLTNGKKICIDGFVFWFKLNPLESSKPRIGIIVSKKLGSAVVRNRCKRLLREAFRLNKHSFCSATCIIYPKDSSKLSSYQVACEVLLDLAKKAKILEARKGPTLS